MKISVAIVLCLVLTVAMAVRPDKAARKQAKLEKKMKKQAEKARCAPTVTWTACDANSKISQTITPTTAENCKSKFTETVTNEFDCNFRQEKQKRGCTFVRSADLTPCGAGQESYTATLTSADCPDRVPAPKASKTLPCNRPFKTGPPAKKGGKGGKGGKNRRPKKDGNKRRGNKNKN